VGALYPGSLTFGSVTVKGTRTLITELYNSGGGPLSITSISTTVGYSQTNTCGLTLSVGSSCEIRVTFKPTGAGELTGKLSIKDNATTKPQVVALSGTGVK
jgi:large repetitive protein